MATIAEVLHYAADHCLWSGDRDLVKARASCEAIHVACNSLDVNSDLRCAILNGLENMGLDTGLYNFQEFSPGRDRQGARYAWLKFAALIAEEQGV